MLKNIALFAAGFITMGIVGVAGARRMAQTNPDLYDEACDYYKA